MSFLKILEGAFQPRRTNFISYFLNSIANRVDQDRVKELGSNAAAAEWLVRNGSSFRLLNSKEFLCDFNKLPKSNLNSFRIAEIKANDSSIMSNGFYHLEGLSDLTDITITNNQYLGDDGIRLLSFVKENLQFLEISGCHLITDEGVCLIRQLKKLKKLVLSNLPNVKNKQRCLLLLQEQLPNCEIIWN